MEDSKRELLKITAKENALKKINNFLYEKVINKKHESKTNLLNKINEIEVETTSELLIKKILEYRQVRNYNREEENSLKANVEVVNKKVTELRQKVYNMMDDIIKKQDKIIHCYENLESESQAFDLKRMKQLVNEHSRLLVRLCCIVEEKHKRSIKLFWRSENKRKQTDYLNSVTSYITYDNLLNQNKLYRDKLANRKEKIQHEKDKINEIMMALESLSKERKEIKAQINEIMIPRLDHHKEKCLKACSDINIKLRTKRRLSSEISLSQKKVGILKYKYLASHSELISADLNQCCNSFKHRTVEQNNCNE